MKNKFLISITVLLTGCLFATSCDDMMEVESNRVVFSDDYQLNHANDTVYGTLGVLRALQKVADRYLILGELRGDLLSVNSNTETPLRHIAEFDFDDENEYLNVKDYYSVINNCNFFIHNADTTVERSNKKLFIKEYVAVKAIRAWTYLQLALNYREVPFFTEPILTVSDARIELYPKKGLAEIAAFMIPDLLPYVDSKQYPLPSFGGLTAGGNNMSGVLAFIPVSLVLGDYYLWTRDYCKAALCYYSTIWDNDLYDSRYYVSYMSQRGLSWTGNFSGIFSSGYLKSAGQEAISIVPFEYSSQNGEVSAVSNLFRPNNIELRQLDGSPAWLNLSANQVYIYKDLDEVGSQAYPVYGEFGGDLRINSITTNWIINSTAYPHVIDKYSQIATSSSTSEQTNADGSTSTVTTVTAVTDDSGSLLYYTPYIILYRSALVYLRLAEAANCMTLYNGYSGGAGMAFDLLKSGLKQRTYLLGHENGDTVRFDFTKTTFDRNIGIHSRGCGQAEYNEVDYALNKNIIAAYYSKDTLDVTSLDSLHFVEDKICDELALEAPFEGNRFHDLMRFAQRRGNDYLAKRVAGRDFDNTVFNVYSPDYRYDPTLYTKLTDENNWYLPLK